MPRICAYPRCFNKQKVNSPVMFHRLPLGNPVMLRLWLSAMNMEATATTNLLTRSLRVCSDHFLPDDYRIITTGEQPTKRLKSTAVPSPFPLSAREINSVGEIAEPAESNELDFPLVEVSLEKETQSFGKNKGEMTDPCVKDFGTNHDIVSKNSDLQVDRDCLLQLFQVCRMCSFETTARIQEENGRFCVIQECQTCSHQGTWWSHSSAARSEGKEPAEGKRVRKGGLEDKEQMQDVCTLTMEFTSELFEYNAEEDQMPSDDDDKVPKEGSNVHSS